MNWICDWIGFHFAPLFKLIFRFVWLCLVKQSATHINTFMHANLLKHTSSHKRTKSRSIWNASNPKCLFATMTWHLSISLMICCCIPFILFFHFFEAHYIHFFSVILLISLKCSDDLFACMNHYVSGWKREIERLHWWNECQAFYMFFLTVSQINWIIKIVKKSLIQNLLGESIVPLEALEGALPCS